VKVLGPVKDLQPGVVEVPLDLRDRFAITVLTSTVSLTPGTVSADVSEDRTRLLVHALHVEDPAALVAEIKQRYEGPIKEIFEC
jgi:multicomponent K+:H+ antiporter subunit E